ncbi:lytic transglycosylase domain-containing protein [Patescibacteria group bacterium]|nr:lytic transglycosylase domain-containing protein [Patescibacteria group bacterium]
MKRVFFVSIISVSLFFIIGTGEAQADNCCICGGFGNEGSYVIENVDNCDTCTEFTESLFDQGCLSAQFYSTSSYYKPSERDPYYKAFSTSCDATTLVESDNCCIDYWIHPTIDPARDCWTNYPKANCVSQAEQDPSERDTLIRKVWVQQKCSKIGDCWGEYSSGERYCMIRDYGADPEENEKELGPVTFTPQLTIPFSDKFNRGVPVTVTGATFGEYVIAFFVFFIAMAGILATVMMMYGGIRYVVSMGSPQKISEAKDTIVSALLGLVLALGTYVILLTINPNLIEFDGLSGVTTIPLIEQISSEGETSGDKGWFNPGTVGNVTKWDQALTDAANDDKVKVNRDYLKAIMLSESSGDPNAESDKGACGLMQLLPSTAWAYDYGITCQELKDDPVNNILIGARYFRDLLDDPCPKTAEYKKSKKVVECKGKTYCKKGEEHWAIAAYNGGQKANCSSIEPSCKLQTWWECAVNPGFAETRNYVQKVEATVVLIRTDPDFAWSN